MEMISTTQSRQRGGGRSEKEKKTKFVRQNMRGSCAIGNPGISHQSKNGPER